MFDRLLLWVLKKRMKPYRSEFENDGIDGQRCRDFMDKFQSLQEVNLFSTVNVHFSKEEGKGLYFNRRGSVLFWHYILESAILSALAFIIGLIILILSISNSSSSNWFTEMLLGIILAWSLNFCLFFYRRNNCSTCGKKHCSCEEIYHLSELRTLVRDYLDSFRSDFITELDNIWKSLDDMQKISILEKHPEVEDRCFNWEGIDVANVYPKWLKKHPEYLAKQPRRKLNRNMPYCSTKKNRK